MWERKKIQGLGESNNNSWRGREEEKEKKWRERNEAEKKRKKNETNKEIKYEVEEEQVVTESKWDVRRNKSRRIRIISSNSITSSCIRRRRVWSGGKSLRTLKK